MSDGVWKATRRMMTDLGQRLGPYEILDRLGGGGMGVVFRAWDERLHREVAIKLLHGGYQMPGTRKRFLQEARAASGLNHPNICTVFDIGEQDGDPYLVMELLEGETLKEKVARGALTAEEIIVYGQEVAEALEVAHAKGIVHRDIKPANIFLVDKPNGKIQAKVLDFGLAKIDMATVGGWASRSLDLTVAGSTVGTLAYMSPEQARGNVLDGRSDLFSLGVVMYEMATRRIPFHGTTSGLVIVQLLEHTPEPVRNWNESVPKELERIIQRLLAKDRKDRFQTAQELQDALGKCAGKLGRAGWFRKTAAVVPLVRVPEPVAREKRVVRRPSGVQDAVDLDSSTANRRAGSETRLIHVRAPRGPEDMAGPQVGGVLAVQAEDKDTFATDPEERRELRTRAAEISGTREIVGCDSQAVTRAGIGEVHAGGGPSSGALGAKVNAAEEAAEGEHRKRYRWPGKLVFVAVLIVAMVGAAFALIRSGRLRPAVLSSNDRLLLTKIQNKTGDEALDGSVLKALEIELRQSPFLNVRGDEAYYAGVRQTESEGGDSRVDVPSRRVAHNVGAKAYLYGEIRLDGTAYVINVDVLNTDSNDKLANVEEIAPTREQIPAAIERVASAIRAEMGESSGSVADASVPLEQEATENVEALHDFAAGEAAMQRGQTSDALIAYQKAVARAPKFIQAQMRLAWLYQTEKAEVSSASAAARAMEAANGAGERVRMLAQFCYAMNTSADYERATTTIQQYARLYPHDVEGMVGLARVLRLEGHLVEALLAGQQAYEDDPFDAAAYEEAELAMIALNRFDAVLQLDSHARRLGVVPSGKTLAAAYLAGKQDVVDREVEALNREARTGRRSYGKMVDGGLYLDNSGQMAEGAAFWHMAAQMADGVPELASTRAYILAQSALNRALTGSCREAKILSSEAVELPHGPAAWFHAGMAEALCGDRIGAEKAMNGLRQSFPKSTAVEQYYLPELQAAEALAAKTPEKALEFLAGDAPFAQLSFTPYLSGLAHLAENQALLATVDFETVVGHRGSAFSMGGTAYGMAEIGLARASAASGDKAKSGAAYQRLALLWGKADGGHRRSVASEKEQFGARLRFH